MIKEGKCLVNGKPQKASYLAKEGDLIQIDLGNKKKGITPAKIDLDIIYEDENVIVLNKQPGLTVHPAHKDEQNTLINALINYFPKISEAVYEKGNELSETRAGLVHRLDRNTSGVMIVAKNRKAMHSLAKQIQNRTVEKKYLALCFGWPKDDTKELVNYLGRSSNNRKVFTEVGIEKGREAISVYKTIDYLEYQKAKGSLLEFVIKTGRTHQIRAQAKLMNNPVLGDNLYITKESIELSKKLGLKRQMVHSKSLRITLPNESKPKVFVTKVPSDFEEALLKFIKK